VVDDLRAMTYTSFDDSPSAEDDYTSQEPLDQRVRDAAVPLMVIFGAEDQIYNTTAALAAYKATVPGVITHEIPGAGHSPNVEKPDETAKLVLDFAAAAPPAVRASPPSGRPRARTQHPADRGQQRSGPPGSR
jgi:pimeloyl-ACP methyl ester carboxylesterase